MSRPKLLFLLLLLIPSRSWATDPLDVWLRTGVLSGAYHGKDGTSGSFVTNINLETEFWLYRNPQAPIVFRMMLANESDLGRTRYFAAGLGQRYFLYTDGLMTQQQTGAGMVQLRPRWAPFLGWDLNVGQLLILSVGDVLSSYATTVDVDGSAGIRYFFTPSFSMDALFGYSYGTSVESTVSASMTMMRILLGVGLTF